ncbi:DoxX family protein [Burkholderia cenocepacia]|uniref:DoxX family protein n=1 Tax=Burkholderia cenocepacia TaxID=95486 RepID=UPI000846CC93|nr:DoxX family protein [Burkholderia cenocepacia]
MIAFIQESFHNELYLLASRIVFTSFFWISAILLMTQFTQATNQMRGLGVPLPSFLIIATIITQVTGSFLVITNLFNLGWLAACGLALFTLVTIPIGHPFWKFDGEKRKQALDVALEHITVIGGCMLTAALSFGP